MAKPESTNVTPEKPSLAPEPSVGDPEKKLKFTLAFSKKQLMLAGGVFAVVVLAVAGFLMFGKKDKATNNAQKFDFAACVQTRQQHGAAPEAANDACTLEQNGGGQKTTSSADLGNVNSTDPVEKGKALSGGACSGTGSKKLGSAPMHPNELSIIVPYGLLAGGHVTPVDHQYYWGTEQFSAPDKYDVLAPGDGNIVTIQYRDRSQEGGKVKGDYRVVISYSCTFFSYFDLATSLSPDIQKQLPTGWEQGSNRNLNVKIPVKQGQVVGKIGGQGLDYAVWDTTKQLKNLLVPEAYNVAEPWKIVTVSPLDYYTDELKKQVLPFYGRTAEPRDGVIDQDVDGKFIGNWFVEGTYGYAGSAQFTGGEYYKAHLAMVRNLYDPSSFMFSIGEYAGQPTQFAIKNASVTPDKADASSGIVKYELAQVAYVDENGAGWNAAKPAKKVTVVPAASKGTALVQMLENRKIKVEVFPGKTPAQVSGFTDAAKIYTRGEDAKNSPTIKNPGAPTSTAT